MVNLSASLLWQARTNPDHLAVVYLDQRVTYGQLADRVLRLAEFLQRQEIKNGDIVALLMHNSVAFVELALAISHIGAVLLPVNYRLALEEVSFILDHAGADYLFADEELQHNVPDWISTTLLDTAAQLDSRQLGGEIDPDLQPAVKKPDDLFRLMYTSGTTGHPKGVIHTYSNFYWKTTDYTHSLGLNSNTRALVVGPMYHVGGLDLPGLSSIVIGGMLCILREYDPTAVLTAIEQEQLNCAWMAPVMLNGLLNLPDWQRFNLDSLQWTVGGGERTPEPRIRSFTKLFPNARYIDAYGLTETCGGDTLMEAGYEISKIGSTGRPMAHVEVSIKDDQGNPVAANSEGEICLRGPKVTSGYWKDPEKTAASFFDDWFRTGDIGYLDDDGFLYLTDRLKDMIISGGENIASSEIERVIYTLDSVSEAAVIGIADEQWGERPEAFVVLHPGYSLDLEQLQTHCREHLAGFKMPKGLHVMDDLPRNASGKVLKRELRKQQ
ncbi:MAG: AMP-binding protein [Immundisolibacteraceae bacterium]|nr:AMP-binding protein [Immundisolibacteraceae bacterium]